MRFLIPATKYTYSIYFSLSWKAYAILVGKELKENYRRILSGYWFCLPSVIHFD